MWSRCKEVYRCVGNAIYPNCNFSNAINEVICHTIVKMFQSVFVLHKKHANTNKGKRARDRQQQETESDPRLRLTYGKRVI
jgi:hypothetical protein